MRNKKRISVEYYLITQLTLIIIAHSLFLLFVSGSGYKNPKVSIILLAPPNSLLNPFSQSGVIFVLFLPSRPPNFF